MEEQEYFQRRYLGLSLESSSVPELDAEDPYAAPLDEGRLDSVIAGRKQTQDWLQQQRLALWLESLQSAV